MPATAFHNEKQLLSLLKQGDQQAFTQLYHLHSERLYLNLLKLVKSASISEEILQDIFVIIWEKRETIHIQFSFYSYLQRIGENKVNDFFRKIRRDRKLYADISTAASTLYVNTTEEGQGREYNELLLKALESLSPQRKRVFEFCKIEGKSYHEVSELLGISTSTINDHIVKATRTIRQFMLAHEGITIALVLFLNRL